MSGVIVAGVDGSPDSKIALGWAVEEARLRGARVRAVLAWSFIDQPGTFHPGYGEEDARRQLDEVADGLGPETAGVAIDRFVVCDLPARALLEASAAADLLVVGSRGLGGFKGLVLGSVSQEVVQKATCPVVVVPGSERVTRAGSQG